MPTVARSQEEAFARDRCALLEAWLRERHEDRVEARARVRIIQLKQSREVGIHRAMAVLKLKSSEKELT